MKHLSLFLISLVWSLATFADDVTIPIIFVQQDEVEVDERTLSFAPEASHDGHTVSIYSYVSKGEIQISVLDEGLFVHYTKQVKSNMPKLRVSYSADFFIKMMTFNKEAFYFDEI